MSMCLWMKRKKIFRIAKQVKLHELGVKRWVKDTPHWKWNPINFCVFFFLLSTFLPLSFCLRSYEWFKAPNQRRKKDQKPLLPNIIWWKCRSRTKGPSFCLFFFSTNEAKIISSENYGISFCFLLSSPKLFIQVSDIDVSFSFFSFFGFYFMPSSFSDADSCICRFSSEFSQNNKKKTTLNMLKIKNIR